MNDVSKLQRTVRVLFEAGISDPYTIADQVVDSLHQDEYESVLRAVMPHYTRYVAGRLRKSADGRSKPVFVPSSGWKDLSELNASECLEIASEYRKLAEQNSAMADKFQLWATKLERRGSGALLGSLDEFREYQALRTKEGMAAAKARGIHVGRQRGEGHNAISRIVELRRTLTFQKIADALNEEGLQTGSGVPWSFNSVYKVYRQHVKKEEV